MVARARRAHKPQPCDEARWPGDEAQNDRPGRRI
jgi:hypothetical protein